ncbi:class I SAM-dependent methyltransferase [Oligoflexus tunisiensis]|uniref:class I SAM-dependent methyltransferase n=1 Tax=Oligoflexus tunisiensis TaxID=708132 RepID=UPI00159F0FF9|nr:class I SAM-dependent methyltransferase [Oligoflexus tunisiensis]
MESQAQCSVCSSRSYSTIVAAEKMFGMGGHFQYRECRDCGHVELTEVPQDITRYYPANYYSFRQPSAIKTFLKTKRSAYSHGQRTLIGALMERKIGPDPTAEWFRHAGVRKTDRILDVGCGSGIFLRDLREAGYTSIMGIDPYIERDYQYGPIHIKKMSAYDLKQKFDFIMLNHSFEHMLEPVKMMQQLARLVDKGGTLLIRVPVIGEAWKTYRENWVGLDAPRHFFIPSVSSFSIMAEQAGLRIHDVVFDSTDFQFWASEQYKRNIPLESSQSYDRNPGGSIFNADQIQDYKKRADQLNREQKGDQASFYLKIN